MEDLIKPSGDDLWGLQEMWTYLIDFIYSDEDKCLAAPTLCVRHGLQGSTGFLRLIFCSVLCTLLFPFLPCFLK